MVPDFGTFEVISPPNCKSSCLWPQELGLLLKDLRCKEQRRSAFFAEEAGKGEEGERREKHASPSQLNHRIEMLHSPEEEVRDREAWSV